MSLKNINKYFSPTSILDIGANIGQFYHEIRKIFPDAQYTLIEGNHYCEAALKGLHVEYYISLLSDCVKKVKFYVKIGRAHD